MNAKEYAKSISNNLGAERALEVAISCKAASERGPTTYLADEAIFYVDQAGQMQLAKDQTKVAGKREKRLKNLSNFWTEVTNILKKEVK